MSQETPDIPVIQMEEVESTQIHSIGHDPDTKTLAIRFKDKSGAPGSLYHYANIHSRMYEMFKGAESVGSYFYKVIKPRADDYPYTKIEAKPAEKAE